MALLYISTLDQPGLETYRTLRRPEEHRRQGLFVAEGEKVVERLLTSHLEVVSALVTPEWHDRYRIVLERRVPTIYVAEKRLLETIVGFHLHQGIMAVGRIPPSSSLQEVLGQSARPHLLAAVDGLTNAENLGVLVRNCAAFGVQALIVGETSSSPFLRRAVRNSMGAVFSLPVVHVKRLAFTITELKSYGVRTIAAHPGAVRTFDGWKSEPGWGYCVVFGSEGEGISPEVLSACDEALALSMENGVDSLNVASASAVFLYEVQKTLKSLARS